MTEAKKPVAKKTITKFKEGKGGQKLLDGSISLEGKAAPKSRKIVEENKKIALDKKCLLSGCGCETAQQECVGGTGRGDCDCSATGLKALRASIHEATKIQIQKDKIATRTEEEVLANGKNTFMPYGLPVALPQATKYSYIGKFLNEFMILADRQKELIGEIKAREIIEARSNLRKAIGEAKAYIYLKKGLDSALIVNMSDKEFQAFSKARRVYDLEESRIRTEFVEAYDRVKNLQKAYFHDMKTYNPKKFFQSKASYYGAYCGGCGDKVDNNLCDDPTCPEWKF